MQFDPRPSRVIRLPSSIRARSPGTACRTPSISRKVAAVVELRDGHTLELEELREFLRAHLSGYKLPRSLTVVDTVPRNATGKAQYPAAKEMALAAQAAPAV
jgi:acyl-CoA synthetase (AMP-forming)/AMP-acid ligase II